MPPRRSARVAEQEGARLPVTDVLPPLPCLALDLIFSLLSPVMRLQCCGVSRAWREYLREERHWLVCDLSNQGPERYLTFSRNKLHTLCARARGQLRELRVCGHRLLTMDALLEVAAANSESLRSIHATHCELHDHYRFTKDDMDALLRAAPRLEQLRVDAFFDLGNTPVTSTALRILNKEPPYGPLHLRLVDVWSRNGVGEGIRATLAPAAASHSPEGTILIYESIELSHPQRHLSPAQLTRAMSFPSAVEDEAGFRALELRCDSPHSAESQRTVTWLSMQTQAAKNVILHNTVLWGLPNVVRCALKTGVSADTRSSCALDRPVLVQAALRGHVSVLKQLLEAGADHSQRDRDGFNALSFAAARGHLDCIKLLLAAGADASIVNVAGDTPLISAIALKHTECAKALLHASDLSITNHEGFNAFHSCVLAANEECFELLLPRVTDPDQRTAHGAHPSGEPVEVFNSTPLHIACQQGQHRMAKALLKRGANLMARDSDLQTPLMYAALQGHLACVVLLLGQPGRFKMNPVEMNAANVQGRTALHVAACQGFEKICGVLLEAGARLDTKTPDGGTPLMYAQEYHPTNAALLALLSGAGPAQPPGTVCDHCGKTAEQASVNNLKACSQFQAVRYCGVECSVAAWPGHKAPCKARAAEREAATKPILVSWPLPVAQ